MSCFGAGAAAFADCFTGTLWPWEKGVHKINAADIPIARATPPFNILFLLDR
jgi:hypothetical protein